MNPFSRAFLVLLTVLAATAAFGQKLEPYDGLRIECPGHAALNGSFVLGALGAASLPLGEALVLAGLPLEEAEKRIRAIFEDRLAISLGAFRLLRAPNPNAPIRYGGALASSGETFATKGRRLSSLLRQAGPIAAADLDAVEISSWDGVRRVAARFSEDVESWDLELRPGDRVFVPERRGGIQVYVLGAAVRPGAIDFERGMTVGQAIARAGGVRPEGDAKRVEVHRRQELLGILDLALGGESPLEPGDVVHIHQRTDPHFVYVYGLVAKPNRYGLKPDMTLLRAVTGAGGFPLGLRRPVAVVSSQISGRIERTEYDLTAIMKGDKPDPFLRPGDRIDVRESGD